MLKHWESSGTLPNVKIIKILNLKVKIYSANNISNINNVNLRLFMFTYKDIYINTSGYFCTLEYLKYLKSIQDLL